MEQLSKNKLGIYSQLTSVKFRRKHGLFRAEGEKCVVDTLGSFPLETLIIGESRLRKFHDSESGCDDLYSLFPDVDKSRFRVVSDADMKKLTSMTDVPGMIAIYRIPHYELTSLKLVKNGLYLLLDGVQDPGNLGTIVRTAHWFGVNRIFASKDVVDIYNPKTVQATMGSLGHVEINYVDLCELIEANREVPVFATMLDGVNVYAENLPESAFIVMGSEGHGVSRSVSSLVSHKLFIPPFNNADRAESLNVGVATGVILSEFRRRQLSQIK